MPLINSNITPFNTAIPSPVPMQYATHVISQEKFQQSDRVFRIDLNPRVDTYSATPTGINSLFVYNNLFNRYYGIPQSMHIARYMPPIKKAVTGTVANQTGMGATYRMTSEQLRQFTIGASLVNGARNFYRTARLM